MPDDLTPPAVPIAETPPTVIVESAHIKELRSAFDSQKQELKSEKEAKIALESRIKELELASLSEVDRLKRENADLSPLRDENGRYKSVVQSLYDAELAAVPEEFRSKLESLSATGEPDVRLQTLRTMKEIMPTKPVLTAQGTVTQPANRTEPGTEKPEISFENPFGDYFAKYSPVNSANISNAARAVV